VLRLRVTVRQLMIGIAVSALIFAVWDSELQFYQIYWRGMARIHADKEHYFTERAARLWTPILISSEFETCRDAALYHRGLKERYEYLSTHPWAPAPRVHP
jgi:hypothetical protein